MEMRKTSLVHSRCAYGCRGPITVLNLVERVAPSSGIIVSSGISIVDMGFVNETLLKYVSAVVFLRHI